MHHPPAVWDDVLRRLRTEMPDFAIEAWILPLSIREDFTDGHRVLHLIAPNPFHRDRVRNRFIQTLTEAATAVAKQHVHVRIGVEGEALQENPSVVAASAPMPIERAAPTASIARATLSVEPKEPTLEVAATATPEPLPEPERRPLRVRPAAAHAEDDDAPQQLNLPATFENFVVGSANALAREACLAVVEGRQTGANPLYIVGSMGSGKSHLARALVSEARRRNDGRTVYCSAEGFTTELTQSIRERDTKKFRKRFRGDCRLLVIEDVQFFEGKGATQGELFHTMEHLQRVGGRIVLTGDRLPREIQRLDRRLASNMASGLVAGIEAPDRTLRREILRAKASRGGLRVPDDCLELLVDSVRGSVRDLEGALVQVVASASLLGRRIDLELTREALRKVAAPANGLLTLTDVMDCVCGFFGVTEAQLRSRARSKGVLVPRQLVMYLCHRYTDASFSEIGRQLGRNHPSVSNAVQKVEREILERAPLRYQVEELVARLGRD